MWPRTEIFWALAVVLLAAQDATGQATVTSTQTIALPTTRPSNAFEVPADFPSVGFETAFLPGYNNSFSDKLVVSLASRMAAPPVIRIGGTSGDRITFNPGQTEPAHCAETVEPCNSAARFILGPTYFDAFWAFYQSAHFSIQAPLSDGKPNRTNIISYVKRAYDALGDAARVNAARVNAVAIGNEVNWFPKPYDAAEYVADAKVAKDAITSALDLGSDPIWEILDTASEQASTGTAPYTVKGVFDAGINRDGRVKYVAEHYYQFKGETQGIRAHLLNHTAVVNKLAHYLPSINATRDTPGARFILSETGGPLGVSEEVQTFFANTLWSVNFQLYAMALGVSRVTGVQRPEAKRSLWVPTAGLAVPGPRVQAPYYALPFVADFVGKAAGTDGRRSVVNIPLNSPVLSAYAMFEGPTLARVAIVNLREYVGGEATRNAVAVRLEDLGAAVSEVRVGRLHADAGTAAGGFDVNGKNITWAGQQWSYKVDRGDGHGTVQMTTLQVTRGVVKVVIPDTEAVIVYVK